MLNELRNRGCFGSLAVGTRKWPLDRIAASVRHLSTAWSHMRQGERSGQCRMASAAQDVDLSVWQEVQGLGILYSSVMRGVMKANVCARTLTSAIVVSIFGMWQATH